MEGCILSRYTSSGLPGCHTRADGRVLAVLLLQKAMSLIQLVCKQHSFFYCLMGATTRGLPAPVRELDLMS